MRDNDEIINSPVFKSLLTRLAYLEEENASLRQRLEASTAASEAPPLPGKIAWGAPVVAPPAPIAKEQPAAPAAQFPIVPATPEAEERQRVGRMRGGYFHRLRFMERAAELKPLFDEVRAQGFTTPALIAHEMNRRNIPTIRGSMWQWSTAKTFLDHYEAEQAQTGAPPLLPDDASEKVENVVLRVSFKQGRAKSRRRRKVRRVPKRTEEAVMFARKMAPILQRAHIAGAVTVANYITALNNEGHRTITGQPFTQGSLTQVLKRVEVMYPGLLGGMHSWDAATRSAHEGLKSEPVSLVERRQHAAVIPRMDALKAAGITKPAEVARRLDTMVPPLKGKKWTGVQVRRVDAARMTSPDTARPLLPLIADDAGLHMH